MELFEKKVVGDSSVDDNSASEDIAYSVLAKINLGSGWAQVLEPVAPQIAKIFKFLDEESAGGRYYLPEKERIFQAFTFPFDDVKVVILGQDPYPTPGYAQGLAFSVSADISPLPRSLRNIYQELSDDLGCAKPAVGDLQMWSQQGVLLLNRVLTVGVSAANSHRNIGWDVVTNQVIRALAARDKALVGVLWGRQAQEVAPLFASFPLVISPHPSPLSARRGFFGSKPFSKVNKLLQTQGAVPVEWKIL